MSSIARPATFQTFGYCASIVALNSFILFCFSAISKFFHPCFTCSHFCLTPSIIAFVSLLVFPTWASFNILSIPTPIASFLILSIASLWVSSLTWALLNCSRALCICSFAAYVIWSICCFSVAFATLAATFCISVAACFIAVSAIVFWVSAPAIFSASASVF